MLLDIVCRIHYTHENDSYKIGNIIIQYELDESTVTSICSVNFEIYFTQFRDHDFSAFLQCVSNHFKQNS